MLFPLTLFIIFNNISRIIYYSFIFFIFNTAREDNVTLVERFIQIDILSKRIAENLISILLI